MDATFKPRWPRWMTEDLRIFHDAARRFFEKECTPHARRWDEQGVVDRDIWRKAGEAGLLCASMPEEYGGAGGSFAHEAILIDTRIKADAGHFGLSLHNAIVAPYILHYGSEEQKRRWLPRLASGELVGAIAMSEPGAGSDLQGVRTTARLDGNHYVINGSKTFITNGQTANLIIVVTKTDPAAGAKGTSLIVVETDEVDGFRRGRNLDKIGLKGQDTSELFFDEVRVPTSNLIGPQVGLGFIQLMEQLPQERLIIALEALAGIEAGVAETLRYVKERKAFGKAVWDFQNTKFKLAEAVTAMNVARAFCEECTEKHLAGALDAATAAMAKYWLTQAQCDILDECLQLHGGYGYMNEYPIARLWADARVGKIYGGTNEIMKELIARSL